MVVHRQQDAYNGEIVVALFEDEATVKTLSRRGGHTWLLPENPDYDPSTATTPTSSARWWRWSGGIKVPAETGPVPVRRKKRRG